MHVAHYRTLTALFSLLILVVLPFGCGKEESPPPAGSPAPSEQAAEPAPEEGEAEENCDIEVLGDREVERAALDTKNGKLVKIEVIDGRRLKIVCPEGEERKGALIIAELKSKDGVHTVDNIVSWKVDLDPDPSTTKLNLVDSTPGVPELNDEDMALLQEEAMPGMVEWTGEAETGEDEGETGEGEAGEEAQPAPAKASPPKTGPQPSAGSVSVKTQFNAGRLKWAELKYTHKESKRTKKVVLDNQATRRLAPGVYNLSVRYPKNSEEWRDAGTLEITEGLESVQVMMKESPSLHGNIVSSK